MEDAERFIVERRITERVFIYWDQICEGRAMAEEADLDPEVLAEDWPHCFLLQTRDIEQIEHFNFTYLGEAIVGAYKSAGIDMDNLFMVGPNAFYTAPQFLRVATSKKPLVESNHFFAGSGSKVLYRQCLLPLGNGKKVEAIFGAMQFTTAPATS